MLHVHTCTDIKVLAFQLAQSLAKAGGHPLQPRHVIVENVGMARWLTMELARINGHCANVHFPLPWSFVWEQLLSPLLADEALENRWSAEVLGWRIARILPDWLDKPDFAALRTWRKKQQSEFSLLELSARLARSYDAYQIYRPDWLLEWEGDSNAARLFNGATKPPIAHPFNSWQQLLWRELVRDTSQPHRARLLASWLSLPQEKRPGPGTDSFVHYFCPSSLTKVLGRVLGAMPVRKMELLVHTASDDYWSDLERDSRRERRRKWRLPEELSVSEQADLEPRILLNNGREHAELLDLLLEEDSHLKDLEAPLRPERDTCLSRLESSLRLLKNPVPNKAGLDDSLRVFSCHSLTRQAEVLHDQIMRLLRQDSSLRPSDFLVVVPDMPAAQPAIEAVWESTHPDARIPWKILGAPPWRGDIGRCLLAALSLNQRQWTNAALLELFNCASLRRKLSLDGNVREKLADLFRRAGYRWGHDHESTGLTGVEGSHRNTFESLLNRLTLGLVTQDAGLISGTLPLDTARDDCELMEALLNLLELLEPVVADPGKRRSMEAWVEVTTSFLGAAFKPEGIEEQERNHLSRLLREMAANAKVGDCDTLLLPTTFYRLLEQRIAANPGIRGGGFDGSLIFAPMLAVRKIPARVVAVLGMDDGNFPRGNSRDELDLVQEERRPGDRSPRDQDRGLFLDTLLQASEHLLFFYTGREQKDNTKRQPSACLNELLDSLGKSADGASAFITEVPLNRHDSKHFLEDSLLQSCDPDRLASANLACKPGVGRTSPLPVANPTAELPKSLSLKELVRFYRNPAEWLLKRSLGLYLPRDTDKQNELEPILHDGLAGYSLRARALELQAKGLPEEEQQAMLEAGGGLAWQAQGEEDQAVLRTWLDKLIAKEKSLKPELGEAVDPVEFSITLSRVRLSGEIRQLHQKARLVRHHKDDAPETHHCFPHWITHLSLQLALPNAQMATYILYGSTHIRFKPIPSEVARAHLDVLVAHCLKGTREWLPWIPELVALKKAPQQFGLSGFDRKDHVSNNPALRILSNGEDWTAHNPVSERLEQLASELVVPMQEATDVG
jgi:exodeoxyribonuclease V gamma subunit